MIRTLFFAVPLAVLLTLTPGIHSAQDKEGTPKMDEMMKKWKEVMTPGVPHKMLGEMVGTWDVESKVWMAGPGTEPSVTNGTSTMTMILGGRFLQQVTTGEMMGMPMNGIGITGFDNFKKRYVGFWIDNTGTAMYTMEGEMDENGKTCTYWGLMDDPMTGEKDKKVKYTLTMVDKNRHIFRIYDPAVYGEKDPTVEMVYTRVK